MTKHIHGGDVYRYENYLDFSSNCNPLGLPDGVRSAIIQAVDSVVHYPDVQCEKLKKAIGQYEQVCEQQIVCGNGAAEVIFSLCLAVKPKRALLPAPTFAEYQQALESVDCAVDYVWLNEKKGFVLDEEILRQVEKTRPDVVFVCNPNNPTGVLTEKELLERLLHLCEETDMLLVLDECFLDFVEQPQHYTMKEYLSQTKNLLIVKAFTKRYAIAGVRLGYGLTGNESLAQQMELVTQPWNVSGLAQAAGIAALKETEYVKRGQELIIRERRYLQEQLRLLGLQLYDSSANYLFFLGPEDLPERMKKHKILIRDCSNYPNLRKGFCRIAVRTHEENEQLINALKGELEWQKQL